jgi:ferredoxin
MKPKTHRVTLRGPWGERRLKVPEDQSILEAALFAGIELPHTCCQGWCITCAGRLIEGKVSQSASLRYYPEDEAEGFVLLCTAIPLEDCVIETHQSEALRRSRHRHGLPAPVA